MSEPTSPAQLRRELGTKLRRMREQASLTLDEAAPKLDKSRSALHRVETGETKATVHLVRSMMDLYDALSPTLLDEVREANNPPSGPISNHTTIRSSTLPTNQSEADATALDLNTPEPLGDDKEFNRLLVEMVTDQAPRLFAVVIEHGHREDAAITAWGMAFEDSAYMVTANGNNHYSLTAPENALNYIRTTLHATPHLVWARLIAANPLDTQN